MLPLGARRTGNSTGPEHTMSLLPPQAADGPVQIPGDTSAPSTQPPEQPASPGLSSQPRQRVRTTRTGRLWVAACVAAVITVALIVFMIQNTHTVTVTFLGMTGSTSLALMLLIAAVGGILLTLLLGSARIIQLRHAVRRRRS
jgi:uncharacterized integral membrane protein